ncbi:nucleoside-diphosphate kinase [Rickettsia endosymbiont of Oedothorax gibbosus]|uniref:nucleoside-diphosphate kinase n=1 Tax=Rickettsia endosymbiont of Oedothorax gibbosus TaxID=931099 RepID=UPI00202449B7|nr:nucleoside-diphosphate kinase [Rickettsia endosymbiont of Oedothorax gibbosus]MCC8399596.1 nucleoside-diphosphate kinase [Rickettsia endosymbiont of Platyusa sonomae]MCC8416832.1 nucleoside-diphosphate kinase [Rickettsia endosymbiont of Gnoriste bilineata]
MTQEYTFSMIKPDATKRNLIGKINSYLENNGLKIVAQKMTILTRDQAEIFYAEHKSRAFFNSLIESIISGPVVLQVLKGENAILQNRKIMGATNPNDAELGTIRKDFAKNIEENSIHGSDTLESAEREVRFFFAEKEIVE